ncbi:MAG: pyridoxine 5'-phosphate synthase [Candidatus Omnitrophica bacterium]|nr:pyridoxine 5'-phosphate synthase [Candidatus Omnitrophota bacterium]MBU0895271.1 pyridoxine 5'-phosphate synthase [Candidatus Omnitrophota bacterium]MBU1808890.1 pyridoxine 5'-phosphate synthase [Candidatus Omnitrophota bacterium]
MVKLGVNIDHVATVREARKSYEPDPIQAAKECVRAGCDSIVCHLREDRRHIKDADVKRLRKVIGNLNLEMSIAKEIVDIACRIKPDQATLVPEKRQEITTEGGLDVRRNEACIKRAVARLHKNGIAVSLFINPSKEQIDATVRVGAGIIEFHTGEYANASGAAAVRRQLNILKRAAGYASGKGLIVNAGHGLNYKNVKAVAGIKDMNELNIGHSIISRAVFTGIARAVKEMAGLIR